MNPFEFLNEQFAKETKNWVNFAALWDIHEPKSFQLQGVDPHQGLCPWTPLGALLPDPRYRLALHALAMCSPKTAHGPSCSSTVAPVLML